MLTVEAPRLHTCRCGVVFSLSARNTREHEKRGTLPLCRGCRFPHPELEVSAEERRAYQRWLEESGLSPAELRDLASCLWPGTVAVSLSDAA